jgi:hypothetical protein
MHIIKRSEIQQRTRQKKKKRMIILRASHIKKLTNLDDLGIVRKLILKLY